MVADDGTCGANQVIDANGNWTATIPALAAREDGHEVTATVTPNGVVTYAVDDGDGKRHIGDEMPYDGAVCAYLVERLKLVTTALHASERLSDAKDRLLAAQITADREAQPEYEQASASLKRATTALPAILP